MDQISHHQHRHRPHREEEGWTHAEQALINRAKKWATVRDRNGVNTIPPPVNTDVKGHDDMFVMERQLFNDLQSVTQNRANLCNETNIKHFYDTYHWYKNHYIHNQRQIRKDDKPPKRDDDAFDMTYLGLDGQTPTHPTSARFRALVKRMRSY
jgi:hypothetical protein